MAQRVEVGIKGYLRDSRGEGAAREIREFLHLQVDEVRTLDVYTLDLPLNVQEVSATAAEPLSDPVVQDVAVNKPLADQLFPVFDWAVEVGYRPGVTDNVGRTAKEAVEMFLGREFAHEERVYTSVQYLIRAGDLSRKQVGQIASDLLANDLIQRIEILSRDAFTAAGGFPVRVPKQGTKLTTMSRPTSPIAIRTRTVPAIRSRAFTRVVAALRSTPATKR